MTSSNSRDTVIHLFAGGAAGTVSAVLTCPLEVLKTRLQASTNPFHIENVCVPKIALTDRDASHVTCKTIRSDQRRHFSLGNRLSNHALTFSQPYTSNMNMYHSTESIWKCLKNIVQQEGPRALFKGVSATLIGTAPTRAIYFSAYSQTKKFFNSIFTPDTAIVHLCSASFAGFTASSLTNPIWLVKTRLQLDNNKNGVHLSAYQCIRRIYNKSGILGFYKGLTASYFGISETVIHFVIYEAIKAELIARRMRRLSLDGSLDDVNSRSSRDFFEFMIAGAVSKTIASCAAYPHEVARTRLREEGNKYKSFWQTLALVYREEGQKGLYRGLSIQLIRQIPNTAIMMATYEAVVYMLTTYFNEKNEDKFYNGDKT